MMNERRAVCAVDTVVIGGGHAGLCMSYVLQELGRDHIVLEKKRALEQWRSARWDSFRMNTPIGYSRLMGQKDGVPDREMGISLERNLALWEDCVRERGFPIREHCEVVSVTLSASEDFSVSVRGDGEGPLEYRAKNVVAAPGNYQIPNILDCSANLGPEVQQLRVGTYTNPAAVKEGAVLIVGSGQTGVQLGEELLQAGRNVYIATSKVKGSVRSYRGEDVFFWLDRTGMLTMPWQALPDPNMRYERIPFTGNDHPISLHSLARMGAVFSGRLTDISGESPTAFFDDTLQENIAFAQEGYDFLINVIERWITENGSGDEYPPPSPEPEWEPHQPLLDNPAPSSLILKEHNINAVLWATGWRADLSWLRIKEVREELGPHGRPEACETPVPGFFWLGFHWLQFLNSGNVAGFHYDAPHIGSKLR